MNIFSKLSFGLLAVGATAELRKLSRTCGSLMQCRLANLNMNTSVVLKRPSTAYASNRDSYSVICDVEGNINYVTFTYDNATIDHTEYMAPYTMGGDSPNWINEVDYLGSSCDEAKDVRVRGYIWSRPDDPCFDSLFFVENNCESSESTNPTASPKPQCLTCPFRSTPTLDCPVSLDDCNCQPGTRKTDDGQCECLVSPKNGFCNDKQFCANSFSQCGCNKGFVRFPPEKSCLDKCPEGYVLVGDTCEAEPSTNIPTASPKPQCLTCPFRSTPTLDCPVSLDDCDCQPGTRKTDEGQCECLVSPKNGFCNDKQFCANSFSQCACNKGFVRFPPEESCLEKCPEGYVLVGDTCEAAPPTTTSSSLPTKSPVLSIECFRCPAGSNPSSDCPKSADDCKCPQGMRLNSDKTSCECLVAPENGFCANIRGCSNSFSYCGCNSGYVRFPPSESCVKECPEGYSLQGSTCVKIF